MTREEPTIVAPATAAGGAIAVVRFSGPEALTLCDRLFRGAAPLSQAQGYTVHYGRIMDGERTIDDVLATVFRAPHSYTGEDSVEISCHGSAYIVSEILRLAQAAGARMAEPGEFTIRAYLAGKLDLSQAEAVADLIASSSRAAHALATGQMRGGYSAALEGLRQKLLDLASLLELELDFSEEDVEFADREELRRTMESIRRETDTLRNSFSLGNALKEGVAVAIAGAPNAGKSTLLNRLLHDDRALVSDIAGTTRDVIEEQANIDGVLFRFLDTAGIRTTDDQLERMGIERTLASIARARIIIHLIDATTIKEAIPAPDFPLREDQTLLTVINKTDAAPTLVLPDNVIGISALSGSGVDMLCRALRSAVDTEGLFHGDTVVSNSRHFQALSEASAALDRALLGLQSALPSDLLAEEIRSVIRALSSITGIGAIIPDNILSNIFSKFCIGK
ncbi:MAG TPA: tRNA uridine-5-carboxymethylaminomethyl(34) synthesis GTPase MnmE [Alistipes sp.]|uniref:tRNA uridine-5-carboxymethylaminomethyl(34) synthesis GTPase MnmE n=1 Tax=Alistipes sp. UBA6068 TaxID=1946012 RepID=UPI000E9F7328|nr:tRNA uridine-5-carboxymethylaminomethyl(34) synthesis GTPase MnmE [Alistipes sp. UBA6068]HBV49218.1 tRNA uridine-5-carboxymethylaminomethyl(34) synthesis GTPase MnmE [Alistipes sp.]